MSLKNGKAAGPDEIPAEAIKADIETATNIVYSLFSKIWEREEIPAEWKEGILIKLPKKGDLTDCSNYGGIMLLSVLRKVLNRILLERIKEAVDRNLRDQQAGFRRIDRLPTRSPACQPARLPASSSRWSGTPPYTSTLSTTRRHLTASTQRCCRNCCGTMEYQRSSSPSSTASTRE